MNLAAAGRAPGRGILAVVVGDADAIDAVTAVEATGELAVAGQDDANDIAHALAVLALAVFTCFIVCF